MADHDPRSSSQNGTAPLLTEAALENATGGLREAFQERMTRDVESLHRVSCLNTAELLTQAYIAGVRDGFVQGAEAQARTKLVPVDKRRDIMDAFRSDEAMEAFGVRRPPATDSRTPPSFRHSTNEEDR